MKTICHTSGCKQNIPRGGRGYVDHAADEHGQPRLAVLRLNLHMAGAHAEKCQRHAGQSRCQQRQALGGIRAVQVGLTQKQSTVSGACGDHAETQIADKHQRRAERAQPAIALIRTGGEPLRVTSMRVNVR